MKKSVQRSPANHKVLLKYISKEVYKSVTFVMMAFVGLFAFFDLIAEVDRLSQPNTSWAYYFAAVFLGLPSKVYEIAPIAALIGSIYALVQLAATSEFTAMRAAGMSTSGVVKLMSRIAFGVVLITVLFGEVVAPVAEKAAVPLRAAALGDEVERDFRSGYWLRDAYQDESLGLQVRFVNFENFTKEGELLGVQFYEVSPDLKITRWVRAKKADYKRGAGYWVLSEVKVQNYFNQQAASGAELGAAQASASSVRSIEVMDWKSTLTPQLLTGLFVRPDRMSAMQLYNYSEFLSSNGQATDNIDLAFAKKVIYPLAIFVMTLISLSFAYLHFRAGGVSVRVFVGVMIGVGFHLVNNLFSHLSLVAKLPPFVSASIPTLIGLVVGLTALWWVSRPAPWMALKAWRKVPQISLDS